MKSFFTISLLIFAFSISAFAQQKMYEPKKGSVERTALMNAIREYDVKRNSQLNDETFVISALRVQGIWAYTSVEQQLPNGIESYGQAHVFLQKVGGKWRVAFSTYNSKNEVGSMGLEQLQKKNKTFPKQLADFAINYLAG